MVKKNKKLLKKKKFSNFFPIFFFNISEDDNLELFLRIVQLDEDVHIIQNDFYKFWPFSLKVKNKNDTSFDIFDFL